MEKDPRWRGDGRELYYHNIRGEIVAVPVDLDSEERPVGDTSPLFRARLRLNYFDATRDGQRFLLVERIDPEIDRASMIDDWLPASSDE